MIWVARVGAGGWGNDGVFGSEGGGERNGEEEVDEKKEEKEKAVFNF